MNVPSVSSHFFSPLAIHRSGVTVRLTKETLVLEVDLNWLTELFYETTYFVISSETLEFGPELVVVSGFHLLDGENDVFWHQRVQMQKIPLSVCRQLSRCIWSFPAWQVVLCMKKAIVEKVFPLVNSVGLNEQKPVFISKLFGSTQQYLTVLDKSNEIGMLYVTVGWMKWKI